MRAAVRLAVRALQDSKCWDAGGTHHRVKQHDPIVGVG